MPKCHQKEGGFVLVVAMVLLLLLSVLGVTITRTARTDLQIAGNDRRMKHAFYKADGGTEAGIELLEENFSCPTGFNTPAGFDSGDANSFFQLGGIDVFDANFARDANETELAKYPSTLGNPSANDVPTDSYRTLRIPDDPSVRNDSEYHTNIAMYGSTGFARGSAIQMSAGYHGMGYSAAAGGGTKSMDVLAQYEGSANSVSKIFLEYVHLIGTEGTCKY